MAAIAVRESAEAVYRGGRLIACFPRERDRQLGIPKSRRRVEKIGGGSHLGHDTQPEIILTACHKRLEGQFHALVLLLPMSALVYGLKSDIAP
jgi:hypothetical protein